jgi:predicted DNA-binding ribbon-helix-helix protein
VKDAADRTIRFERADLEALEAIAREADATVADLVRKAVRAYIARRRG